MNGPRATAMFGVGANAGIKLHRVAVSAWMNCYAAMPQESNNEEDTRTENDGRKLQRRQPHRVQVQQPTQPQGAGRACIGFSAIPAIGTV